MWNSGTSLGGYFMKINNPVVHTLSRSCTWTWRDSTEALHQSGYRFIREISNNPSICLARKSKTDYAVCILRRYRGEVEDSGEIRFWKWLNHDNILALYEKFADADSVYFVTDPVVGGHVSGLLEKSDVGVGEAIREEFFRNVTRHALSALVAMHEAGLAHLDFKWSNVWLNAENNVFLGGFVKTRSIKPPGDASVSVGQLTYGKMSSLAPEILRSIVDGTDPDLAQLPKADIWAVGVALVEALTDEWVGGIRLHAKSNDIVPEAVLKALIDEGGIERVRSHLLDQGLSAAAIAFITDLLKPEPSQRPTAFKCLRKFWIMEKKANDAMTKLLKLGLSPEDAIAVEATIETLPKLYKPLGGKLQRFGYDIQKVLFEDVPNGTVVVTAKCHFNSSFVSVKAVQERLCEKGDRFYWQQLRHERVMQLVDSFTDSGVVFFVTDFMPLGSVEHHAKKDHVYDEPPLRREAFYRDITTHMVEALCYLHQQGFAHLDFHWRHVLLHENSGAKLGGFRHMNSLQDEERAMLGYMPFRAPEAFIPGALKRTTLQKADIWSLGAALLHSVAQLSIGGHHFDERQVIPSQRQYTFANIEDNLPRLTKALARGGHSQEFQDLVISLTHFQPELRPTAAEIRNHPWLLQSSEPKPGTDVV